MNLSVKYTKTNSVADDCIKSNISIGLCHWLFVFGPQFWSDETLLGRKTSVPTIFLLIGHLGGQHVDWRLQKGSMFLYLWNAWDVIFLEPACCCFTSMSVSVLLCYSGTLSWRRTSWRVINLLWFDQGQLDIELRVWQDKIILFHLCIIVFINKINWQSIPSVLFTGNPTPQVKVQLLETELEEAGPSHGNYIIPVNDITSETSSGGALDAVRCKHWIRPGRTFNPTTIQSNFTNFIGCIVAE